MKNHKLLNELDMFPLKGGVLIVDDEPDCLNLLSNMLVRRGYKTRMALDGHAALEAVAHLQPDLILLDIRMPGMDGFEVCRRLKAEPDSHDIPIIFISGLDETASKIKGFEMGGVDYITKPVRLEEVLARVSTHLILNGLKNRLERRVEQRTAELADVNTRLKQEINRRKRKEMSLLESESRLRRAHQLASIGHWDWYIDTNELRWSEEVYQIFGQPLETFTPTMDAFKAATHPEDRYRLDQEITRALSEKNDLYIEHRIVLPDGGIRYVQEIAEIIETNREKAVQVMGTIQDITRRKQMEESIRESEELYRVTMENISDPIFLTDDDGRFTFICPNVFSVLGYSEGDLWEMGNISALLGDDLFVLRDLEKFGYIRDIERAVVHADGRSRIYLITVKRVAIGKGTVLHVCHDITERKRSEEALRESEETYRLAMDATSDGLWDWNLETGDVYYSPAWTRILEEENVAPKFGSWESRIHPDEKPDVMRGFEAHLDGATTMWRVEHRIRTKQGNWKWVLVRGRIVSRDAADVPLRMMGTMTDITGQKQAEEWITNQNVMLERAVQDKQEEMEKMFDQLLRQEKLATIGRLTGSIAHELRNPLGAVKQSVFYLNLLAKKKRLSNSNPKVHEHLALMETEINTSERVISDVLRMSSIKPVECCETDLQEILDNALSHCHIPERVQVVSDLAPELLDIWADAVQLRQVFINLISNAVQAIDGKGRITIQAREKPDSSTVIDIIDTGMGIDPADLDKVWDPLFTTKATGTGLGLSVCKQIVDNHGGRMVITSKKKRGTTVRLIL